MKNRLTIEAFAEWVEKQNPDMEYEYDSRYGCAFCQYLLSVGFLRASVECSDFTVTDASGSVSTLELDEAIDDAVSAEPWDFGALAKRLRASSERNFKPWNKK